VTAYAVHTGDATGNPELARLGHVALRTPDLDASLWFFDTVVGLELVERTKDAAYLRAWGDHEHHTLALLNGDTGKLDHVGWRTKRPEDVDEFARRLVDDGLEIERVPPGAESGQGAAIRFRTPGGLPYEIYYDVEKRPAREGRTPTIKTNSGRVWDHGISPRRVDHVNFVTPDVAAEEAWTQSRLGFRTHEYMRLDDGTVEASWLSVTALAHDLALGRGPSPGEVGLHHVAYVLDNASDVLRAAEIYAEHGLTADHGPGRHAISQAVCIYVRDPGSGHRLELYSGAYLVLDPDWEPIEWTQSEYRQWWGPQPDRSPESAIDVITPC
jgi:biphenyl-2,3-diol 1,2-dioxygenase